MFCSYLKNVLCVPEECYSRNASCALNLISTFLLALLILFIYFSFYACSLLTLSLQIMHVLYRSLLIGKCSLFVFSLIDNAEVNRGSVYYVYYIICR
jgi:hypothetical protein